MGEVLKILGLCVFGAVAYGETQDHSLIRYCPEYFTVFHPDLFGTRDLTLLALGWGFVATWWVGLILGCALAFCARAGDWPQLGWRQVAPGVILVFVCTAAMTAAGFLSARATGLMVPSSMLGPVADLPLEVHRRVSVMLVAYNASYFTAFVGGFVLCAWVWARRRKLARGASPG